ncbi:hypothetical protein DM01DRAFT_131500 [Hesseltinella vesiculosa]|uniref:Uncharacterized protein n=1 Tax=Hesseltinella vesiculosa TaxID=101127 RepID=A0A1X2GJR8_9FUNG|nr:hypothetical protein DM01DRAFT_131500 [Hesseltinella vesiculosa]
MQYWSKVPHKNWDAFEALQMYDNCLDAPLYCILQVMVDDLVSLGTRQKSLILHTNHIIAKLKLLMALNSIQRTCEPESPKPVKLVKNSINVGGFYNSSGKVNIGHVLGTAITNDNTFLIKKILIAQAPHFITQSRVKIAIKI